MLTNNNPISFKEAYPLVSILIPCYNHEKYITEALDSIIDDEYANKEIIIIDDGSRDNSVRLIESWIDLNQAAKVKFVKRPNKGLCATLNELVQIAEGKYLVVLASDDILCNNTLTERVRVLENNASKLVLVSDAMVINSEGVTIHESILRDFHNADKSNYFSDETILDEIIFRFSISGAVVMMNREIFNLIGPYPEDLKAEDLYFYLKSASLNKLMFLDRIVSKYRIHQNNTSGTNPELSKTVIKTYLRTVRTIPGFKRKLKVFKRIAGIIYSILKH